MAQGVCSDCMCGYCGSEKCWVNKFERLCEKCNDNGFNPLIFCPAEILEEEAAREFGEE